MTSLGLRGVTLTLKGRGSEEPSLRHLRLHGFLFSSCLLDVYLFSSLIFQKLFLCLTTCVAWFLSATRWFSGITSACCGEGILTSTCCACTLFFFPCIFNTSFSSSALPMVHEECEARRKTPEGVGDKVILDDWLLGALFRGEKSS